MVILWCYDYLVIAGISVQKAIIHLSSKSVLHQVNERDWVTIFAGGIIKLPVIHTDSPPNYCASRDQLVLIISHHSHALFSGTHWMGLTHLLSEIGYTMPALCHLITFFLTTFITGFNLLWCCTLDLYPSSMNILCMQKAGLIP